MKELNFEQKIDIAKVLSAIGYQKDADSYEAAYEECEGLLEEFFSLLEIRYDYRFVPVESDAAFAFLKEQNAQEVCMVLFTLGKKMDARIAQAFAEGDALTGMLLDAMASQYLFTIDWRITAELEAECRSRGVGTTRRYTPLSDIDAKYQHQIVDQNSLGVTLSESCLMTPLKSCTFLFGIGKGLDTIHIQHDCRYCSHLTCPFRNAGNNNQEEHTVIVLPDNRTIRVKHGQNLLKALRAEGFLIPAPCGGNGTCGKCHVIVNGHSIPSCRTQVTADMTVTLPVQENAFTVQTGYQTENGDHPAQQSRSFFMRASNLSSPLPDAASLAIAVDIGTTTLAAQLLSRATGEILASVSSINSQRVFGADVITRIQSACEGNLSAMSSTVKKDLLRMFEQLLMQAARNATDVQEIWIAGNTTMTYLLLEQDCASLGHFPFSTDYSLQDVYSFSEIFHSGLLACPVRIVPWISAFVGGDITAGLLFTLQDPGQNCLLVDLGTNGEMALWTEGKILATSTAAGPAFEGGNLSCGSGSIPGAVCAVACDGHTLQAQTIDHQPAIGICGTGVLDAAACLIQNGWMDESGLLEDPYFDDGVLIAEKADGSPVLLTQQDIRELQLAKSAVRAGIEVLLDEAGLSQQQIDRIFLAGGFGQHIRIESAVAVGLIPSALSGRVTPVGNSSLGGCVRLCRGQADLLAARAIPQVAKELNLSADPRFNQLFMEYMMYEKN
ncbi:MAG TPA: DUF4445 domain-containing protein [Firmicutes bacterium]|nr:DUF4445 domain-containing protein [Bacillota bacterium]